VAKPWRAERRAIRSINLLRHTAGACDRQFTLGFDRRQRWSRSTHEVHGIGHERYAESLELATPPGGDWNYNDRQIMFIIRTMIRRGPCRPGPKRRNVTASERRQERRNCSDRSAHAQRKLGVRRSGNPEGSRPDVATPRELGTLRHLYIDDGSGRRTRILPEGWVKKYAASPTPNALGRQMERASGQQGRTALSHDLSSIHHGWPRDAFLQGNDRAICDRGSIRAAVIVRARHCRANGMTRRMLFAACSDVIAATSGEARSAEPATRSSTVRIGNQVQRAAFMSFPPSASTGKSTDANDPLFRLPCVE